MDCQDDSVSVEACVLARDAISTPIVIWSGTDIQEARELVKSLQEQQADMIRRQGWCWHQPRVT